MANDQGFSKFDEISELQIDYAEKNDLMTKWRVTQMSTDFIEDKVNMQDMYERTKKLYLKNIMTAQKNGEIKSGLSPELIWIVT